MDDANHSDDIVLEFDPDGTAQGGDFSVGTNRKRKIMVVGRRERNNNKRKIKRKVRVVWRRSVDLVEDTVGCVRRQKMRRKMDDE